MAKLNPTGSMAPQGTVIDESALNAMEAKLAKLRANTTMDTDMRDMMAEILERNITLEREKIIAAKHLAQVEAQLAAETARKERLAKGPAFWLEAPGSKGEGKDRREWPAKVSISPYAKAFWKSYIRLTPAQIRGLFTQDNINEILSLADECDKLYPPKPDQKDEQHND